MAKTIPFPKKKRGRKHGPLASMKPLVDDLFQVLPADSVPEICDRLRAKGWPISLASTHSLLNHVRKYANHYDWSIPHSPRGPYRPKDSFFWVLLNDDGTVTVDPDHLKNLKGGLRGLLSGIYHSTRHESTALQFYLQYLPAPDAAHLVDMFDNLEFLHKRAKKFMGEVMNGQ
jgi:hypothetical protein